MAESKYEPLSRTIEAQNRQIETGANLAVYLAATATVERDHPDIVAFARKHASGASDPIETAVRLYNVVRDGIRYDP